jgi:hypothetical protein
VPAGWSGLSKELDTMAGVLKWLGLAGGALALFLVLQFIYLVGVLAWSADRTRGLAYYGLPRDGRARYRAALRRHARLLRPMLRLVGRFSKFSFDRASIRHADLTGPKGTCTVNSFVRGISYEAQPEDVFVVTQMKCGTTWMQHVVYEVVQCGRGDIVESGRTLYGVAPWLEAETSVPVDQAPLHGAQRPTRIIKTHLPASACPFSPLARYIYVVRHPVSCFASCADFIATNMGVMAPPLELTEQWFCSRAMWWTPWTDHVTGWWQRSQVEPNVLFVRFEDMKRDLAGIARRVADFLGVPPLSDTELDEVVRKCSFAYMQEHRDAFEMNPPHLLQTDAEMFLRGTVDRHRDVPEPMRRRILAWCGQDLAGSGFDVEQIYPEAAAPR